MATTTIANIDSNTFQLGTQKLTKGDYTVAYKNELIGINQKFTNEHTQVYLIWSDYRNSNGDAYGSFALAATAISAIVAKGAASDVLLTDVGAVTQITSATTGVTLNNRSGQVTTFALALAADASSVFTITNSLVTATSIIQLTSVYATASAGMLYATVSSQTGGSFVVELTNVGTASLNATGKINFTII